MSKKPPHWYRWRNMLARCSHRTNPAYFRYGGRGIYVCNAWKDFETFQAWCLKSYEEGKSLDRKNNDGPYTPNNCKWSTMQEQRINSRSTLARKQSLKKAHIASIVSFKNKYGDPVTRSHKYCKKCDSFKSIKDFTKRTEHKDGLACWCRDCSKKYSKEQYARRCNTKNP